MNFDRFGFKAMDMRFSNVWIIATLISRNGEAFEVEWNYEGKEKSFSVAWIKPETICQCTGLRDSEGNLIYENDILSVEKPGEEPVKATVKFDESESCIIVEMRGVSWYWGSRFFRCAQCGDWKIKVIGNKFDKEGK